MLCSVYPATIKPSLQPPLCFSLNQLEIWEASHGCSYLSPEFGLSIRKWKEGEEGTGARFPQESERDEEGNQS